MQIKGVCCAGISLCYMMLLVCAADDGWYGEITDPGPDSRVELRSYISHSTPCNNSTTMNEIQNILSSYALNNTKISTGVYDCSDISGAIWALLIHMGYNCSLVTNCGTFNHRPTVHMFVWVHTNEGVIVIEPTHQAEPRDRIGKVLFDMSAEAENLYLRGWEFSSPEDHNTVPYIRDLGEISMAPHYDIETPINEVGIHLKSLDTMTNNTRTTP